MLNCLTQTNAWRKWAALPLAGLLLLLFACQQQSTLAPSGAAEPDAVYARVEEMPEYIGEPANKYQLVRDVAKGFAYPAAAKESGLSGSFLIEYVVAADGSMQDVQVLQDLPERRAELYEAKVALREAAIKAARKVPGRWKPGRHDGRPVAVNCRLSVELAWNTSSLQGKTTAREFVAVVSSLGCAYVQNRPHAID
jgi:hypothetical protein